MLEASAFAGWSVSIFESKLRLLSRDTRGIRSCAVGLLTLVSFQRDRPDWRS